MGVLDVSKEVATLAYQLESSTKKIPSGAHLWRVNVSLRKHASAKQSCDLERIDTIVFGFATVNGFHIESMTEKRIRCLPVRRDPPASTK